MEGIVSYFMKYMAFILIVGSNEASEAFFNQIACSDIVSSTECIEDARIITLRGISISSCLFKCAKSLSYLSRDPTLVSRAFCLPPSSKRNRRGISYANNRTKHTRSDSILELISQLQIEVKKKEAEFKNLQGNLVPLLLHQLLTKSISFYPNLKCSAGETPFAESGRHPKVDG
jgi:hypothetical protein